MNIQTALGRIADKQNLSNAEMVDVMRQIMSAGSTDVQIGAFLLGMRIKGETLDEITGGVQVLREFASGVEVSGPNLVDIVGTGGDGANLFNVSTAACFVVAAAGGRVAKHGNRSVSSSSGSADVLEAAGVRLDITPTQVTECVNKLGIGFMFALMHHSAMRHVSLARKELGLRTLFNILGPMSNPAGLTRQLIGVYDGRLCRPMTEVLARLGSEHVLVVHSADGLDEISLAAETHIAELKDGMISEYTVQPEQFGFARQSLRDLEVEGVDASLQLIRAALGGEQDERSKRAANMVALNAGAALYVAGVTDSIEAGVSFAGDVLQRGAGLQKLEQLAAMTQAF
ncbi:MAG: anthranilate phosphoribosyltransferase [Xanthomonadales bacterium]|nr:anthranilate phosphoribosyltransferase [Gammaproteobacteria bacterium]MBT8072833.1 anthranilate phosphoribosyltransferase [Gammaproteobacteria bacterium]NNK03675.1 anthranilate phosphoribosyltransferase [Xanthomonadales bacterium]NNK98466.1 anthranilate phosphoribosyltransferase [Xanthomonadales bacterium]